MRVHCQGKRTQETLPPRLPDWLGALGWASSFFLAMNTFGTARQSASRSLIVQLRRLLSISGIHETRLHRHALSLRLTFLERPVGFNKPPAIHSGPQASKIGPDAKAKHFVGTLSVSNIFPFLLMFCFSLTVKCLRSYIGTSPK